MSHSKYSQKTFKIIVSGKHVKILKYLTEDSRYLNKKDSYSKSIDIGEAI